VDPRAHLGNVEKRIFLTLPGLELQPLGHPARSHTDHAIPAHICFVGTSLNCNADRSIFTDYVFRLDLQAAHEEEYDKQHHGSSYISIVGG
jgi:hypothetical protein